MKPLSELKDHLSNIKGVCFDIDDTFSSHGKITDVAFTALWDLKRAGFNLIPVTGRPAGWCDLIARFWPVDAVVGENGAFSFYMQDQKLKRLDTLFAADAKLARDRLKSLKLAILKQYPHVQFASDQDYREYDLAIDFCEDVSPWKEADVDALVKFCEAQGAIAKISSIHVNTWFGRYTKIEGIRHFLKSESDALKLPSFDQFVYAGDSPNDEPMFQAFPLSVGVANVKPFLAKMKSPPTYVTPSEAGQGFAEIAKLLLNKA